jgi:hypothetical protein
MGNAAPTRSATEFEVATLHRVRALLEDNSSKTSKQLLKRLWAAAIPPEVPYAPSSLHWAKLGFQHLDPRADLRGGGCLALEQLVFALETFPSTFVHIANQVCVQLLAQMYTFYLKTIPTYAPCGTIDL